MPTLTVDLKDTTILVDYDTGKQVFKDLSEEYKARQLIGEKFFDASGKKAPCFYVRVRGKTAYPYDEWGERLFKRKRKRSMDAAMREFSELAKRMRVVADEINAMDDTAQTQYPLICFNV